MAKNWSIQEYSGEVSGMVSQCKRLEIERLRLFPPLLCVLNYREETTRITRHVGPKCLLMMLNKSQSHPIIQSFW